jgi:uncharacterized membrane protein YjjP (DUF1212 family)
MNEVLKREYKSLDEVVLKPNQVLIKPIKPIIDKGFINKKFKIIVTHAVMLLVFSLGVLLLFQDTSLKALGAFLLGVVIMYTLSIYRK